MTRQECHLWYDYLRNYPMPFQRQKPILRYIVDFYCAGAQLAVELDGSQHYEPEQVVYDRQRSSALAGAGVAVLRFTNRQVDQSFFAVCEQIDQVVQARVSARNKRPGTSSTACGGSPSPTGEG
jgi:very-short-patch-repair endonuclease